MNLHSDFINTQGPYSAGAPKMTGFEKPKFGFVRRSNRKVVFIYDSTADTDSLHQIVNFIKSFVLFTQDSGIEIGIIPWAKDFKPLSQILEKNTLEFREKIFYNVFPIPSESILEYDVVRNGINQVQKIKEC